MLYVQVSFTKDTQNSNVCHKAMGLLLGDLHNLENEETYYETANMSFRYIILTVDINTDTAALSRLFSFNL